MYRLTIAYTISAIRVSFGPRLLPSNPSTIVRDSGAARLVLRFGQRRLELDQEPPLRAQSPKTETTETKLGLFMDGVNPSSPYCGLPNNDEVNYLQLLFPERGYVDPFVTITPSNGMASWDMMSTISNGDNFLQYLQFDVTEDTEPLPATTLPMNGPSVESSDQKMIPTSSETDYPTLNRQSSTGVYVPMNNEPSDLSNQIPDQMFSGIGQLSTVVYNQMNNVQSMESFDQHLVQTSWHSEPQIQSELSTGVYNLMNNEPYMKLSNQIPLLSLLETDNLTQCEPSSTPAYIPMNTGPSMEFSNRKRNRESWESNHPNLNGQSSTFVYSPTNNGRSKDLPNKKHAPMLQGTDYQTLNEPSSTGVFNPTMNFNQNLEGMVCRTHHPTLNEQSINGVNTPLMHSNKKMDQEIWGTNNQSLNDQTLSGTNILTPNDQPVSGVNTLKMHSNQIWDQTFGGTIDPTLNDESLTCDNTVRHSNQIQDQMWGTGHPTLHDRSSTAFNVLLMHSNRKLDQTLQGTDPLTPNEKPTRINPQMISRDPSDLIGHVGGCNSTQEGINGESQMCKNNLEYAIQNEDQKPHFPGGEIHINSVVANTNALALDGNVMDPNGWSDLLFNNNMDGKANDYNPEAFTSDASGVDCSGCKILREMVHSNGVQNKKLIVHGQSEELFHAWIENKYIVDGMSPIVQRSFVNFQNQSFESIKKFIVDYAHHRAHEGFSIIRDSLPAFIDTLSVQVSHIPTLSIPETYVSYKDFCDTGTSAAVVKPRKKTGIAAQRERTGKLHIRDLAPYFHTPIEYAAKQLNLCVTVLKKVCRKHNMKRWPHRKIKGIDMKLVKLRRKQRCGEPVSEEEILRLQEQRARIYDVCGPLYPK